MKFLHRDCSTEDDSISNIQTTDKSYTLTDNTYYIDEKFESNRESHSI